MQPRQATLDNYQDLREDLSLFSRRCPKCGAPLVNPLYCIKCGYWLKAGRERDA